MRKSDLSKFISLILRHSPEAADVTLDKNGYANVEELIEGIRKHDIFFNKKLLEEIVFSDNKQRYSYNENKTKIRANQGHSIKVDIGLQEATPPDVLYHGTAKRFLSSILKSGVKPMSRQWVHLSEDEETAINVGKRHGSPLVVKIDTKKMIEDGFLFYLSENNVWLCKNAPVQYLNIE